MVIHFKATKAPCEGTKRSANAKNNTTFRVIHYNLSYFSLNVLYIVDFNNCCLETYRVTGYFIGVCR